MLKATLQKARDVVAGRDRAQQKRRTRYTYTEGPMTFLAQQIQRRMQEMGWPTKIHAVYRSPEDQQKVFDGARSKVRAWGSAHQYYEAADIIHAELGWHASQKFWDDLRSVGQIVSEEFGVPLVFGYDWGWDFAHIEIASWREFRDKVRPVWQDVHDEAKRAGLPPPGVEGVIDHDLQRRFFELMPDIYKRWAKSRAAEGKVWVDWRKGRR